MGRLTILFLMHISEVFTIAKTSSDRRDAASVSSLSGATALGPTPPPWWPQSSR
jgi:hypothetical protein